MIVFKVRAEPIDGDGPPAGAFVVAEDLDEAILLLRKDINFSGYALPPAEMVACLVDADEVRAVLGEDAAHEKGVYGFDLIGAETPAAAVQLSHRRNGRS
jgi:hypothetical protein